MAAQKLSRNIMAELGGAMGTGLSTGLQALTRQLIEQKAQDRVQAQLQAQRGQYIRSLMNMGVPQHEAEALSFMPEKERMAYMQRGGMQSAGIPQAPAQSATSQPSVAELINSLPAEQRQELLEGLAPEQLQNIEQEFMQRQQMAMPQQQAPLQGLAALQQRQPQISGQQPSFLEVMSRMSPAEERLERRHQEQLAEQRTLREQKLDQRLEERKERRFDEHIHPRIVKAIENADAAERQNIELDAMAALTQGGKEQKFLSGAIDYIEHAFPGINGQALLNAETAQIKKFTQSFMKNMGKIFKGKVSNAEMEQFLKGVPNLMMDPEGRMRVIGTFKLMNDLDIGVKDTMADVIERYPNITPTQFELLVDRRMRDQYGNIGNEMQRLVQGAGRYSIGQKLESLPNPKSLPAGSRIRTKNGDILRTDGSSWKKEAKE